MNSDVRNLVALQDVELTIASLQKQISEIPIRVQGQQSELERLRQEHQQRLVHSHDLAKKRRTLEGEVDMLRTRLARFKDQLMAVKTNKEYTAMLHEIQMAEEQIRVEEDKILEIMEEAETLEKQLKAEERELESKCSAIQAEIRSLESSVPGLEAESARLLLEREAIEVKISSEMLGRYRKLAPARKGMGLAEAKGELCGACHVRIRPQVCADLLTTDNVHTCESCSRILFMRDRL